MDQTLLVLDSISFNVALGRFTLRDCTVFVPSGAAFDLRTEAALLRFERVRIVGYDCGSGGSCTFATAATMMWLSDCQILGGFGQHSVGRSIVLVSFNPNARWVVGVFRCTPFEQ